MDESKPPIITQAKPFFHSAAVPLANAMGNIPIAMARVVIKIGRILSLLAIINASL